MNANENSGLKNDGQRNCSPKANSEKQTSAQSRCENANIATQDERKQTGDAKRGNDVEKTGKSVAAASFRPPGLRCFSLESMEDSAHPKPTGQDGKYSGNETGGKSGTKRVHGYEIKTSILE
jgi:hypothetical protein